MSKTFKIAFLDDHSVLLDGIRLIFQKLKSYEIYLYSDYLELKKDLKEIEFDLVVTDLNMPEVSGLFVVKDLFEFYPNLKLAIFTQHDSIFDFKELESYNIYGYILKSEPSVILCNAIIRILKGEKFISKGMHGKLQKFQSSSENELLEGNIIHLLEKGKSMKEISRQLEVTEKIVEYRLKKLEVFIMLKIILN